MTDNERRLLNNRNTYTAAYLDIWKTIQELYPNFNDAPEAIQKACLKTADKILVVDIRDDKWLQELIAGDRLPRPEVSPERN